MFDELKFARSFGSDNHSGVHPKILEAVVAANRGHAHSYGMDEVSELALEEFRRLFGHDVHVFYVFNGTAANVMALKLWLRTFESAIVSDVAHMHLDECGAPEAIAGNKLYTVPTKDGLITVDALKSLMGRKGDQHYAQPKMLSLTQPTELGTTYSPQALRELIGFAREHDLKVHIDGTRLIHASTRLNTSLKELTFDAGVDIVSFGGTKNGLLGAEAVVFTEQGLANPARFYRKQLLQLPSKTRFLAAQYYAYLKDDLWAEISRHCCAMADLLKAEIHDVPEVQIMHPVQSNALFVKVPHAWIKPLREKYFFYVWDEEECILRWMMSFDIQPEDIHHFGAVLKSLASDTMKGL
jgi:threonine aldolase